MTPPQPAAMACSAERCSAFTTSAANDGQPYISQLRSLWSDTDSDSGLTGYSRRGLVDWTLALRFIAVAVPLALAGALAAGSVAADVAVLPVRCRLRSDVGSGAADPENNCAHHRAAAACSFGIPNKSLCCIYCTYWSCNG